MEDKLYSGNLKRDYARFAFPSIINLCIFHIYSLVDGVFVGNYVGAEGLAAVNLALPLTNILYFIAITFSVGSGVLISESLGAKNNGSANRIYSQNILFIVCAGTAITVLVNLFIEPFCRFLGADETLYPYTADYIRYLSPFILFVILEYNLECLIKEDGKSIQCVIVVVSAQLSNIFLDWLFMAKFRWGVAGAAAATGIAQLGTCLVFIGLMRRDKNRLFRFQFVKPEIWTYLRIASIGISDGMMELCTAAMVWLYNKVLFGLMGDEGVSVFAIVSYVNSLVIDFINGAGLGMEPLVSYHRGAGNRENCLKLFMYAMLLELVSGAVFLGIVHFFAEPIARLFIPEASQNVLAYAAMALRRDAACYIAAGFNMTVGSYFVASEKPGCALTVSLARGLVVHGTVLLTLYFIFHSNGIWWSALINELIVSVIGSLLLHKTKSLES